MQAGYWENVNEIEQDGFVITLWVAPETESPDWCFESEEEEKDLYERIKNGSLLWFVAKVVASKNGIELASDFLGGCCYSSINEFTADGYYNDMVETVIKEAKKAIEGLNK